MEHKPLEYATPARRKAWDWQTIAMICMVMLMAVPTIIWLTGYVLLLLTGEA